MKKLLVILFVLLISAAALASGCYFKYSYVSGMNRICVYHCIEGDTAITIGAYEICPISL